MDKKKLLLLMGALVVAIGTALAARLPAIMTVPLILFILPVLFIVIIGPAGCSIVDAVTKQNGG